MECSRCWKRVPICSHCKTELKSNDNLLCADDTDGSHFCDGDCAINMLTEHAVVEEIATDEAIVIDANVEGEQLKVTIMKKDKTYAGYLPLREKTKKEEKQIKKFEAFWGDGYRNIGTEIKEESFFSEDCGYSKDDIKEIQELKIGESVNLDSPSGVHRVKRRQ